MNDDHIPEELRERFIRINENYQRLCDIRDELKADNPTYTCFVMSKSAAADYLDSLFLVPPTDFDVEESLLSMSELGTVWNYDYVRIDHREDAPYMAIA